MEQRCPFCRETCLPDDPQVVPCAACGARHHLACFAEGGRCAATGCGAVAARIGTELVPLDRLVRAAADPVALAELRAAGAPRPVSVHAFVLLVMVATAFTVGVMLPILFLEGPLTALVVFLGLTGLVAGFFALRRPRQVRPRVVVRDEAHHSRADFDPIFGVVAPTGWVPGVLPDQTAEERERLAHDRPALPLPASLVPERCPTCDERLREPGEEPEPLAFCFHCGASLAPEAPEREPPPK